MKQDLALYMADQPPLADGLKAQPVGTFRFKSDLRNHCAIVQPRLYDGAMATQITLSRRFWVGRGADVPLAGARAFPVPAPGPWCGPLEGRRAASG